MNNKLLFYPKDLNIKLIINRDKELTDEQKRLGIKNYQRVLYPISRIIQEYRLNKSFKDESLDNLYVNLNKKLLEKIFGNGKYFWIMDFLLRNKILIKNKERYVPGLRSDSYRIGDKYLTKHLNRDYININTDKTLYNNLNKQINIDDDYINKVYYTLSKIKINHKKAIELLNKKLELNDERVKYNWVNERFIYNYFDSIIDLDLLDEDHKLNVFTNWMINILKITEGDFFVRRRNNGRVYTNITSLPKELRECLYIENESNFKDIDIANSQPFLFNNFILKNFNFEDDLFGDKYEDLRLYIKLTEEGKLYEYLMDKWNLKDRELFKKEFFGNIFYCKLISNITKEQSIEFGKLFPNVLSLVLKMKSGNYKNLAIQLQNFEAGVIIDTISKQLFNEDIFHFTIHDSILCLEENSEYVKELLQKELKIIGLNPTIKIK